jgi:hypothetical protein
MRIIRYLKPVISPGAFRRRKSDSASHYELGLTKALFNRLRVNANMFRRNCQALQ